MVYGAIALEGFPKISDHMPMNRISPQPEGLACIPDLEIRKTSDQRLVPGTRIPIPNDLVSQKYLGSELDARQQRDVIFSGLSKWAKPLVCVPLYEDVASEQPYLGSEVDDSPVEDACFS
eukprot:1188685-Rhodomonas_salina.5